MALKYINISNLRPSKIYPNLDFWFENKPSGTPVLKPFVLAAFFEHKLLTTKMFHSLKGKEGGSLVLSRLKFRG
jgi:hypothetical protein